MRLHKHPIKALNKYLAHALTGTVHDLRELDWRYGIPLIIAVVGALTITIHDVTRARTMPELALMVATSHGMENHDEHSGVDGSCSTTCVDGSDVCNLTILTEKAIH